MKAKTNFNLTGTYVEDKETGFFTGFFSEFPEAISQGKTFEEVEENLFNILPMVLEVKHEIANEDSLISNHETITKSYKFQPFV